MTDRLAATMLLLTVSVLAGCGPGPAEVERGPEIVVDEGLAPRLSPDRVGAIVLGQIRINEGIAGSVLAPPRIVRMTMTLSTKASKVEAGAGDGLPERPGGGPFLVWVVRAEGTFATSRTPPGGTPMTASSGYYVIADIDGSIVGFGVP